jgi:hypothetical protein
VLRHWLEPSSALAGTALWTTAPLIVHFGQVPAPDILATTGIAAAFLFALRGQLAFSSGAFLFSLLAKLSIIIYGLPVLIALLLARDCRSIRQFIKLSLRWGLVPLTGELTWLSLSLHDPPGSWVVFGGYRPGEYGSIEFQDLIDPRFYVEPMMYLLPFGCGIVGIIGWLGALGSPSQMNPWLKGSIVIALGLNYVVERIVWIEPQYTVPVLFWLVIAASFGFPRLFELFRRDNRWKVALGAILLVHLVVVIGAVCFLKASRVPNWPDLAAAGQQTPVDARVVVYVDTYRTSPPVWLNRNTLQLNRLSDSDPAEWNALARQLPNFQKAGFDYLMIFDVVGHYGINPLKIVRPADLYTTDYTDQGSLTRRFFDSRLQKIFEGDHVVLYRLTPTVK